MNYDRFLTRVFDKYLKEMIYSDKYMGLVTAPEAGILFYDQTFEPFNDRFVPMMCTGWKDKNDKLIYKGDICQKGKDIFIIRYNDNYGRFEKEYITMDFPTHELAATCVQPFWCGQPNKSEIIGNQWENPELMEVKA